MVFSLVLNEGEMQKKILPDLRMLENEVGKVKCLHFLFRSTSLEQLL